MASLNTLRTKFGWVLSVIVGLALLAFVLTLDDSWLNLGGARDPQIGSVEGRKVKYSEYVAEYDRTSSLLNVPAETDEIRDQISDMAWSELIARRAFYPAMERLGVGVTEGERGELVSGRTYSPILGPAFTNPETGEYDVAYVQGILDAAKSDPRIRQTWASLMEKAVEARQMTKFGVLVEQGAYVNHLEVEQALAAADHRASGRWAGRRYADVSDSLVTVTEAEVRRFYDENRARYAHKPTRTLSYVLFPLEASEADRARVLQVAGRRAAELYPEDEAQRVKLLDSLAAQPVAASSTTRTEAFNRAGAFAHSARSGFADAADGGELTVLDATLEEGAREIPNLTGTRELVHWAQGAAQGQTSGVLSVSEGYVVATVARFDEYEHTPLERVEDAIRQRLIKDKKFAMLAGEMRGKNLDQIAAAFGGTPEAFEGVDYNAFYLPGVGVEPRVFGAMATAPVNGPVVPIQGNTGAFAFVVEAAQPMEAADPASPFAMPFAVQGATATSADATPATPETERLKLENEARAVIQRGLMPAMTGLADTQDMRSRYF